MDRTHYAPSSQAARHISMKIRELDLSENPINTEHAELGLPPIEQVVTHPKETLILRVSGWLVGLILLGAITYLSFRLFTENGSLDNVGSIVSDVLQSKIFWAAVLVGLAAQTIDGALGMAYGITCNTFLLLSGIPPATATASVHIAEVFTTGISGIAHLKMRNVDVRLFLRLLLPGITGAVLGAWFVTHIDGNFLKPYISVYLLIMGIYLISKIFHKHKVQNKEPKHVAKLALFGGFSDSVGGGGWGPIVTTTLIGSGHNPRMTIGSVNFTEFFLTFGSAIAFSILIDNNPWPIVAGLVFGGIFSAPLAAKITQKLQAKTLLLIVGVLITFLSLVNLYK